MTENQKTWKNVYVFISSTFNDMHAERDYLVKKVFPELRIWCNERHLKLIDIDLRWGVSEEDATRNKRVIDVCLNNIDKSRPFFLCLMGQRRGWVPGKEDINPGTLNQFPLLSKYLGTASVTELEIIHALLEPLDGKEDRIRRSLVYFRMDDYLKDIANQEIREFFSPESNSSGTMEELNTFKNILRTQTAVFDYQARWDDSLISPELTKVNGKDLSQGRLCDFQVEEKSLSEHILCSLKKEILAEFPERNDWIQLKDEFEVEAAREEIYLFEAADGYIDRPAEEEKLLKYVMEQIPGKTAPYLLTAAAGSGKTSLLAHLISENRIPGQILYRFAGITVASAFVSSTLETVYMELHRRGLLDKDSLGEVLPNPMYMFDRVLRSVSDALGEETLTILFDAVDQWGTDFNNVYWIPDILPDNIRLIISFKNDADSDTWKLFDEAGFVLHEMPGMTGEEEKNRIVTGYLSQFLKAVDERQLKKITSLPGSNNPLFLKIVLQELRIYGSFETLMQQLERDYGSTPKEAFAMVLERLEREQFCSGIDSGDFIRYTLGIMACAREDLKAETFPYFFSRLKNKKYSDVPEETLMDGLYALMNHLSPYLMQDRGTMGYLYDSFRQAVRVRYQENLPECCSLLAWYYYDICNADGGDTFSAATKDAIARFAYYVLQAGDMQADRYYNNPWFLLSLLKKAGSNQTVRAYKAAEEAGWGDGCYQEIGSIITQVSLRIRMCPHIVFYELKRKGSQENAVIRSMTDRIQKELDAQFLYPAFSDTVQEDIFIKEIQLLGTNSYRKYLIIKGYLAIVNRERENDTVIRILRLEDETIIKKIFLGAKVCKCSTDGEYLYVVYENNFWETFSFPDMKSLSGRQAYPAMPDMNWWLTDCRGYAGEQYDLYARYEKRSDHWESESAFYRLRDGFKVAEYQYSSDYTLVDQFYDGVRGAFYYIMDPWVPRGRIWQLRTGRMIFDEEWWEFIASEGQTLCLLHRGNTGQFICLTFTELEDGSVQRLERVLEWKNKMDAAALCHGRLYVFSGEVMAMFDEDLQYVGEVNLNVSKGSEHMFYHDGKILILLHDRIQIYSEETILQNMKEGRIPLRKESGTMNPEVPFVPEEEEGWKKEATILCEEEIAVVFVSANSIYVSAPEYLESEDRRFYSVKVIFYRRNEKQETWEKTGTWEPDILVGEEKVISGSFDNKPWVVFQRVRIDWQYREMQLYSVCAERHTLQRCLFWKYNGKELIPNRLVSSGNDHFDDFCEAAGCFIFPGLRREGEKAAGFLVIFDLCRNQVSEIDIPFLETEKKQSGSSGAIRVCKGEMEVFIRLYNRLAVYSLKENRIVQQFSRENGNFGFTAVRKYGGILTAFSVGDCAIHSPENGKIIHKQRLETEIDKLAVSENGNYLSVVTKGGRHVLYRMAKISELDQLETAKL